MIVDTSAVVSIAMEEPNALALLHKLHEAPTRFMFVASWWLLQLCARRRPQ